MSEYTLAEKPALDHLQSLGYTLLPAAALASERRGKNEVILRGLLIEALRRINPGLSATDAEAVAERASGWRDNPVWLRRLREGVSRKLAGGEKQAPIRLVDYDDPSNNTLTVVRQLEVEGAKTRIPDVVVFVNGIPLVVIELKSPLNPAQGTFDAIHQIRSLEKDAPRLFASNVFNIASNEHRLRYAATGADTPYWLRWRDPWPYAVGDFASEMTLGLTALLEPRRLLDIVAHFVVFEAHDDKVIKKVCRYQQYRAVLKLCDRVAQAASAAGGPRAGLVWHTQGSGKSLTMVFAALRLKLHRGVATGIGNPNVLVITDRVDLHGQISKTFVACGVPNPVAIDHIRRPVVDGVPWQPAKGAPDKHFLVEELVGDAKGKVLLSTLHKLAVGVPGLRSKHKKVRQAALDALAVAGSDRWVVLVDEAHRTQERDLGAILKAMLPDAMRFGFTGTPIKRDDLDTFTNFGAPGERYLDKYGIDDAVADGATVKVLYQARKTEWHLHGAELDVLFDQWFAHAPPAVVDEIKKRGVTRGDLARFEPRIRLIALDIWTHYRTHVMPDGFKAQVVAIDRRACVAYKEALDGVIAEWLVKHEGVDAETAAARAGEMSAAVYSPGQHDAEKHPELVKHQLAEGAWPALKKRFEDAADPLRFLVVCNKLLTGFDAPIEQAMYLDNPLTGHSLLQAIARTNRRYGEAKAHGLIIDYMGVTRALAEALSEYRREDVAGALVDRDHLHDVLVRAHHEAMDALAAAGVEGMIATDAARGLVPEDVWLDFRGKAHAFIRAYAELSPDPRVLLFQVDVKHVAAVVKYGRLHHEQAGEEVDFAQYSAQVREMLRAHLEVTGLTTMCALRPLDDPAFWDDFEGAADVEAAAVRKLAELQKVVSDKAAVEPARYAKFSDRIRELLRRFHAGLMDASAVLAAAEAEAKSLVAEGAKHEGSSLDARAYGVFEVVLAHVAEGVVASGDGMDDVSVALRAVAGAIDGIYRDEMMAPARWQEKTETCRLLRRAVADVLEGQRAVIPGWHKAVPAAVEAYAMVAYARG